MNMQSVKLIGLVLCVAFLTGNVLAKDLKYKASVATEGIYQNLKSLETDETFDSSNLIIRPTLDLSYTSAKTRSYLAVSHNEVFRSVEDNENESSFTNYRYGSSINAIENILLLSVNGSVNYNSTTPINFLVTDFITNPNDLAKTTNNAASLRLNIPKGRYFGFTSTGGYAKSKSDRSVGNIGQLDSTNNSASAELYSGSEFERVTWLTSISDENSDRGLQGEYTNQVILAELNTYIINGIGLTFNGYKEENFIEGQDDFMSFQDFSSFGVGLRYQQNTGRYVAVTYNKTNQQSSNQDGESDTQFVGIDAVWNFTQRTSVRANLSRRFFGRSGSFSWRHQAKALRTIIDYSENITSFSRLSLQNQSLGTFVCADGAQFISDCFQPNTLDYELAPGERFNEFATLVPEVNDEVILRKALRAVLGYSKRKLNVSLELGRASNEYLETNRLTNIRSGSASLSYRVGRKTTLTFDNRLIYSEEEQTSNALPSNNRSFETTLSLKNKIGRGLETSLAIRRLERTTEGRNTVGSINGITGDIVDRRITLELKYQFSQSGR